jgi:hypothetical protein
VQCLADDAQESDVIRSLLEERQACHGPIEDMVDEATRSLASMARHARKIKGARRAVKEKRAASPFSFLLLDFSLKKSVAPPPW